MSSDPAPGQAALIFADKEGDLVELRTDPTRPTGWATTPISVLPRSPGMDAPWSAADGHIRSNDARTTARDGIESLLEASPSLEGVRDDLVFNLIHDIAVATGHLPPTEAIQPLQHTTAIAQQLTTRHPDNPAYSGRLAWVREVLAHRQALAGT